MSSVAPTSDPPRLNLARCVEREWLDELSPADERAIGSRRDLQKLNSIMGNVGIVASMLSHVVSPNSNLRIVELGAGDGTFLLRVAGRLDLHGSKVEVDLIDQQDLLATATINAFERFGWRVRSARADIVEWFNRDDAAADVMFANLFLHHFDDARLARLLASASARCDAFLACEPKRSRFSLWAAHLVGLIGCNAVTRHDAIVSVRAGFRSGELSALWPDAGPIWSLSESSAGMFSQRFCAIRTSYKGGKP